MSDINGVLPEGSIGDPANLIGEITGEATGTVGGPGLVIPESLVAGTIEAALASLDSVDLNIPPAVAVDAPDAPLVASPELFKVHIVGDAGEQYVCAGDLNLAVKRNCEVVVPKWVLDVLHQSQGVEFTYLPA